jgi:iron complex transport system ATP-binding protein
LISTTALAAFAPSGKPILEAIDLNLAKGQTLGVYGPNGSGKSTLLRALAGVSRGRRLQGEVRIDGVTVDQNLEAMERARRVLYFGSDFIAPFELEVRELFDLGAEVMNRTHGEVSEVVERLGLKTFLSRDFKTLSDCEKQLMMFARALIQKPEVLVFDESFSKLDLDKLILVGKTIRWYSAKGSTIIVASHDLNFLTETADEFLFLNAGKKVAFGNVSLVLNSTTMELLYPELALHVVVSPETGRLKILY